MNSDPGSGQPENESNPTRDSIAGNEEAFAARMQRIRDGDQSELGDLASACRDYLLLIALFSSSKSLRYPV